MKGYPETEAGLEALRCNVRRNVRRAAGTQTGTRSAHGHDVQRRQYLGRFGLTRRRSHALTEGGRTPGTYIPRLSLDWVGGTAARGSACAVRLHTEDATSAREVKSLTTERSLHRNSIAKFTAYGRRGGGSKGR